MKRTLEDDKVFSFNLSAFVTAARSVTMIMNVEFVHVTGFKGWYENKQEIIQSDDFDFFNKMRKATVHINRVKPNKKVSLAIFESVRLTESIDRIVNRDGKTDHEEHSSQEDTKKAVTPTEPLEKNVHTSSRIVERFFKEYPEKDLDVLCEKYLHNLTILVDECEQLFNNASCC